MKFADLTKLTRASRNFVHNQWGALMSHSDKAIGYFRSEYRGAANKERFLQNIRHQFQDRYCPSLPTLERYATDTENAPYKKVADFFISLFDEGIIHNMSEIMSVYRYLIDSMEFHQSEQFVLGNYEGVYDIYRRGYDSLINGEITIGRKGPVPWFYHQSRQDDKTYSHDGFLIFSLKRLFFVGVGKNYFRPIILRRVPNPRKVPMPGILLTERISDSENDVLPLACKTVMFHKENRNRDQIDAFLANDSTLDGVVYGWVKDKTRKPLPT